MGGLGYPVADLSILPKYLVAYGGFRDIDLKPGETVIVAPAMGAYSGAAVEVALQWKLKSSFINISIAEHYVD